MARSGARITRNLRVVPKSGVKIVKKLMGGGRVLKDWTEECAPSNAWDEKEEDVDDAMAESDTDASLLEVARLKPSPGCTPPSHRPTFGGGCRMPRGDSDVQHRRLPTPSPSSSSRSDDASGHGSSDTMPVDVVMTDAGTQTEPLMPSPEERILAECADMMETQLLNTMAKLADINKLMRNKL